MVVGGPTRWGKEPHTTRSQETQASATGCAPAGTRPRDLRSSYITLRVYGGIPLTQIAKEVGTSIRMIELHYAGVIANWDGKQVPAIDQIKAARRTRGRGMDVTTKAGRKPRRAKGLEIS